MTIGMTTGCYEPSFTSCDEACSADGDCAPGHTCTSAGLCASADHASECEAPPDAAADAPSPVGTYAMLLTNQDNGCAFGSWMAGAVSTVQVAISEHAAVTIAEPQGNLAVFLDAWLGSHIFAGVETSDGVSLVLAGNKMAMKGMCSYTFDASFVATQSGNLLSGNLLYEARTNGAADCGVLTNCTTRQAVSGTRGSM